MIYCTYYRGRMGKKHKKHKSEKKSADAPEGRHKNVDWKRLYFVLVIYFHPMCFLSFATSHQFDHFANTGPYVLSVCHPAWTRRRTHTTGVTVQHISQRAISPPPPRSCSYLLFVRGGINFAFGLTLI